MDAAGKPQSCEGLRLTAPRLRLRAKRLCLDALGLCLSALMLKGLCLVALRCQGLHLVARSIDVCLQVLIPLGCKHHVHIQSALRANVGYGCGWYHRLICTYTIIAGQTCSKEHSAYQLLGLGLQQRFYCCTTQHSQPRSQMMLCSCVQTQLWLVT